MIGSCSDPVTGGTGVGAVSESAGMIGSCSDPVTGGTGVGKVPFPSVINAEAAPLSAGDAFEPATFPAGTASSHPAVPASSPSKLALVATVRHWLFASGRGVVFKLAVGRAGSGVVFKLVVGCAGRGVVFKLAVGPAGSGVVFKLAVGRAGTGVVFQLVGCVGSGVVVVVVCAGSGVFKLVGCAGRGVVGVGRVVDMMTGEGMGGRDVSRMAAGGVWTEARWSMIHAAGLCLAAV